ncbi:hypothetical protein FE257_011265 [Aspergillus nanangensis]|uniref:Uncharacterized protein n=1 Tax=Aspergillus nanangensis TaxID=2582783 RepID=A0AAD4CHK6_ASPNN|nr:hypothetical protein FE257_011265 [Aspergillus nanangensis]
MPVKWTPETDQRLLLKILETHDFSLNPKKVSDAWLAKGENPKNQPTPRAITERLVRLRQLNKDSSNSNSEGHFSIGKGATNSAASTPRKPRAKLTPGGGGGSSKASSGGKRKQPGKSKVDEDEGVHVKMERADGYNDDGDDDVNDVEIVDTPTRKRPAMGMNMNMNMGFPIVGSTLKLEPMDDDPFLDGMSPSKRVRRASTLAPGMVSYLEEDGDEGEDDKDGSGSSSTEYVPKHEHDHDQEDDYDLFAA